MLPEAGVQASRQLKAISVKETSGKGPGPGGAALAALPQDGATGARRNGSPKEQRPEARQDFR